MQIPLSSPDITEKEKEAVLDVLSTPNLSLGPKLQEFESKICDYIGTKYAVAVNSGTSGLHLVVRALGIKDADEVITTPFSFIASSNCILFERAKPVFVDIDSLTFNIGPEKIEEKINRKTKAILAVDVFGHPAEWDHLQDIVNDNGLMLIDDACEAIGAEYKGKKIGNFGEACVFAFYPNKQITTGEGGVIVTDNKKIADLCKSMRNQGRGENNEWLQHERLGYNYRISDINCALGIVQLERIDEILKKRKQVAYTYNKKLNEVEGIETPYTRPHVTRSWFVYVITLNKEYTKEHRDTIIQELRNREIGSSNYFAPIHLQPFYRKMFGFMERDYPITENISGRTIALPFYSNLTESEINYVIENLVDILREMEELKR